MSSMHFVASGGASCQYVFDIKEKDYRFAHLSCSIGMVQAALVA